MNELMEQLHDIEGLDPISQWPLGIAWWLVIAFAVALIAILAIYAYRKLAFKRSWKYDTFQQLANLERNLSEQNSGETVKTLSEYIRRIAMHRFSRKECASLTGRDWLRWLTKHDPKRFVWDKKGLPLIEVPYAPSDFTLPTEQIQELIRAAKRWVR